MRQDAPMYAYIPAKDLARARRFYEQTIGLKPKQEIAGGVVQGQRRQHQGDHPEPRTRVR